MSEVRTYLDWNASAPLRPEARAAMIAALDAVGNASSVHAEGRRVRSLVEEARARVAKLVGAKPSEVVFTSGATEANNWALSADWDLIFVCGIEHASVLAPACRSAARVIEFPAGQDGVAQVERIAEFVLRSGAPLGRALVSLQMANNETGVIQPVSQTAMFAREHGLSVHTDATQAAGRVPINFRALGVDLLSISSHKLGGPKGAGALLIREGSEIEPLIVGGGQERRRRAGTENVAAIAGFGAAATAALADLQRVHEIAKWRDLLESEIRCFAPEVAVMGASAERLANTSCIAWPRRSAETLVIKLDLDGIAVSAGSACSSGKVGASHVLAAMGVPSDIARGAIRVSLGPTTGRDDVLRLTAALSAIAQTTVADGGAADAAASDERILEGV
jgi:cysteine desulfurase